MRSLQLHHMINGGMIKTSRGFVPNPHKSKLSKLISTLSINGSGSHKKDYDSVDGGKITKHRRIKPLSFRF